VTFEHRNENKSCSACPKDQHKHLTYVTFEHRHENKSCSEHSNIPGSQPCVESWDWCDLAESASRTRCILVNSAKCTRNCDWMQQISWPLIGPPVIPSAYWRSLPVAHGASWRSLPVAPGAYWQSLPVAPGGYWRSPPVAPCAYWRSLPVAPGAYWRSPPSSTNPNFPQTLLTFFTIGWSGP